jgi:hypothetical protein
MPVNYLVQAGFNKKAALRFSKAVIRFSHIQTVCMIDRRPALSA